MKLFIPRFDEDDLYEVIPTFSRSIENSALYEAATAVTSAALPEVNQFNDEIWSDFYLPLKRKREVVAVPVTIAKVPQCENKIILSVGIRAPLHISPGQEALNQDYLALLQDINKLTPFLRQESSLIERIVPYDIRTGKIPGKYVLEELMSEKEKEDITQKYQEHKNKGLKVTKISLDDYLATAALCYKAIFGDETKRLTPTEMYRRWSYQHSIEAFSIKDPKSKKEFSQKQQGTEWQGCHLFWLTPSRIHLYPPEKKKPYFSLTPGLSGDESAFIKVIDYLIEKGIPFQTPYLESVLEYLAGNTHFRVNQHCKYFPSLDYHHSPEHRRKYFPHISWDPLKIPKWR